MHYLKREFERLIKYTQGLGVKVTLSSKDSNDSAECTIDGKEITIYDKSKKGPLSLLLDVIHELGHHRAWIDNGRKEDLKTDKILVKQDSGLELTELQRKHIYEMEKADSNYQYVIHNEVGSKIPLWRLKVEVEVDIWIYKYYWIKGEWPFQKDIKNFRKRAIKRRRPKPHLIS